MHCCASVSSMYVHHMLNFRQSSTGEGSIKDTWNNQKSGRESKIMVECSEENRGAQTMVRSDSVFDCLELSSIERIKDENFKLFTFSDSWWQRYRRGWQQRARLPSSLVECACMLVSGCVCANVWLRMQRMFSCMHAICLCLHESVNTHSA